MQYEVEIKSLLGSNDQAEALRERLKIIDPSFKLTSRNRQLNHYFVEGDLQALAKKIAPHLAEETQKKFKDITSRAQSFSVRTRDKDGVVLLVVKASVGEDSSSNGVARMEFEEKVDLTLSELDELLISAGFVYQAKWSREREEYVCKGITVCLDRNAGYGWLAEFEKVVDAEGELEDARREIKALMDSCGVQELQQERLERMFQFYNAHWSDYYGTDKVFTIA
jgi:adenylate cyclase class IV